MGEDATPHQPPALEPHHGARVVLLVPRAHVKAVKLALEKLDSFDRHHGISPDEEENQRMRIHTTIPHPPSDSKQEPNSNSLQQLKELNLHAISPDITHTSFHPSPTPSPSHNPLRKALLSALLSLPPSVLSSLPPIDTLTASFPDSYSIYPPLLLLPGTSLPPLWRSLLHTHAPALEPAWRHIASALHCTHVALNSPIPASNAASSTHASDADNVLRSPVNLKPLYGDFGPPPTPRSLRNPSPRDFEAALWVSACQNGVLQTWAPLYTMFSRGNVKEKARILALPSLPRNRDCGRSQGRGRGRSRSRGTASSDSTAHPDPHAEDMAAVDLYAGIGYFALPYRLAGASPVLCWEINPWSIEGLRRGCELNKQRYRLFTATDVPAPDAADEEWMAWRADVQKQQQDQYHQNQHHQTHQQQQTLYIFALTNTTAPKILHALRPLLPPIRHANLGLLPVSRPSWPAAVRAIDKRRGGWVHVHENVGEGEEELRRGEVEREFVRLVRGVDGEGHGEGQDGEEGRIKERGGERAERVKVEHVEKVKLYAPGVVHVVFDVYVPGTTTDGV